MIWLQNTVKDFKKQKNRYRVNLYKNNVRKDAIAGFL